MKPRNITIAISRCAIAACMLLAGGGAIAAVATTPHNLGSDGPGPNTFSGTAEICVFCHTPHGGDVTAAVPLWNRVLGLTLPATYTTYDTLGTTGLDGATAPVGSVSIACLSCHDGTQAMDVVINEPGSGLDDATYSAGVWTGSASPTGAALIGTVLTDDHPIGIQYGGGGITAAAPTAATNDVDFIAPDNVDMNGTTVWWVDSENDGLGLRTPNGTREKTDMQLYTRTEATVAGGAQPFVECASCHDPHSNNATFLRVSNDSSAVCLACHTK